MKGPSQGAFAFSVGLLSLLCLAGTAEAKVASTTLGRLEYLSESILVGRVVRVLNVPSGPAGESDKPDPSVRVAEVRVLEWIKGPQRPARVWYVAERTWLCGASWAVEGEKALFFLTRHREHGDTSAVYRRVDTPLCQDRLKELTGSAPLWFLCWSGYGRIPVEDVEGIEHGAVWTKGLRLPAGTPTIPAEDPRYSEYHRRVSFAPLLDFVRRRNGSTWRPTGGKAVEVLELVRRFDGYHEDRERATETLRGMEPDAVPMIFQILEEPGNPWRAAAADALLEVGDRWRTAIEEGLRSVNADRRRAAAYALMWASHNHRDWHKVPLETVLAASTHPDPEVRKPVVLALGASDKEEGIAAVVRAFDDENLDVRLSAARAVLRLWRWSVPFPEALLEAVECGLLRLTGDESVHVRREAWQVLSHVAGPATLPVAKRALEDVDRVVRVTAGISLGRIRTTEAAECLAGLLGSDDSWVRRSAAYALGLGKMAVGVEALAKSLEDGDETVVYLAIDALGSIGPGAAAAVPALERLRQMTANDRFRYIAGLALEKIRGE